MRKIFGSIGRILAVFSFLAGLVNFFIAYSATRPCSGICTLQYVDWKSFLWYGITFIVASVFLYYLGTKLKNNHA
jgi:hypothetical protein